MRVRKFRKSAGLFAAAAATALVLAACAEDDGNGDDNGNGNGDNGGGDALAGESITIAAFAGWDEGTWVSYLWKAAFESQGATVDVQFADVEPVYSGVATGEWDVAFDAWLPATHEVYWDEFGDDLEDLGAWYEEAPLTIAVNEDAPINSLEELADSADEFDNRIVGIDPGAGLTQTTEDSVIPTYGLDDMEFVISSAPAMLTELDGAVGRGDNIVVTLWKPHWAYDEYPIRDLEDPENALGDPDQIHTVARPGFSEDYPEAADWIGNFQLSDADLAGGENIMFNENEAEDEAGYEESMQQWLDENPGFLDQLTGA